MTGARLRCPAVIWAIDICFDFQAVNGLVDVGLGQSLCLVFLHDIPVWRRASGGQGFRLLRETVFPETTFASPQPELKQDDLPELRLVALQRVR